MNKKENGNTLLLVGVIIVFIIGGIIGLQFAPQVVNSSPVKNSDTESNIETEFESALASDYISIPCFDILEFIADTTQQNVDFYNPETNKNVNFELQLIVTMGEGGKVLYKSDLIKPGNKVTTIELSDRLPSGVYNAYLLYNCYSDSGVELNSSKLNFTLEVKNA